MNKPQALAWDPTASPTFWINHASRAIMRRFEERLRPLGFGMAYLPVVVALDERGPLQQKDLLEHARIEQPTMAALLARMERDRLITRKPDPRDARGRLVSLTPRAKATLTQVRAAMHEVVEEALAGVNDKQRASLTKTLKLIVENLAEPIS